jgi:hypothetical protein
VSESLRQYIAARGLDEVSVLNELQEHGVIPTMPSAWLMWATGVLLLLSWKNATIGSFVSARRHAGRREGNEKAVTN